MTNAAGSRLGPQKDVERVQLLLAAGADKTLKDGDGKTALDVAKERKKKAIIPLLE